MSEKSYSVNLPQTGFPMKANSAVREVETQRIWDEKRIYEKNLGQRNKSNKFVVHDGPPYLSSGKIHLGHALNKILKDIVTKYKAQRGFYSPFVPGYDSHGLPIENAVLKDVKGGRAAFSPLELRKRCKEFALSNLKGQEENFRRLGVWGNWAQPYITLDPKFEAAQIRVFGKMADAGYLYKGLKPVYWCSSCETALAEAEVEYADHMSHSVYVKFAVKEESIAKLPDFAQKLNHKLNKISFVIWTTTPWTLPANLAISLHPDFSYQFLQMPSGDVLVVASALKEAFLKAIEVEESAVKKLGEATGRQLEFVATQHPFIDRESTIILGTHVTADTGTGAVHTAPGHGLEDYEVGQKYKLDVLSPLDNRGIFTEEGGRFAGLHYSKANPVIVEYLKEIGALLNHAQYQHSYPHCWRCHKPLIFRATEQWFASVDGFRKKALEAIDTVTWIPASGRDRIHMMIESRSDWCISRQRVWGVPIPVFYCQSCQEPLMKSQSMESVAKVFEVEGSDSWWEHEAEYFLGDKFACVKCGGKKFDKETDIMDVWFDSGTTHASVLDGRADELGGSPCEMYLEGSDQHRGWFNSSLLTSVAIHGRAPYKTVLTHGFTLDENGRKMSKSLGNTVEPKEVIQQYGADVLRLWVASLNYTDDMPISKSMLAQLSEVFRKLRNTARYILGNLNDFDPVKDSVSYDKLSMLDQYMLHKLQEVVQEVVNDFDRYEFFKFYQLLQNFCVVDLSSFYFDIVKDRLYTSAPKAESRRAVQTVLNEVLQVLVRLLVPVTPHLAEDIWQFIPDKLRGKEESVLLTDFPAPEKRYLNDKLPEFWNDLIKVRYTVNKALELARAERKIGSSLEAQVLVKSEDAAIAEKLQSLGKDLPGFFITSQAIVYDASDEALDEKLHDFSMTQKADVSSSKANGCVLSQVQESGLTVVVVPAQGTKCARCWKFTEDVGHDKNWLELCLACADAVGVSASV